MTGANPEVFGPFKSNKEALAYCIENYNGHLIAPRAYTFDRDITGPYATREIAERYKP